MAAGQDPALFWQLTPLEIDNILTGCGDRARQEHNARMVLAWHTGAFARPHVKLPKLSSLLETGPKQPSPRQSCDEMIAALKAHTTLMERTTPRVSRDR